MYQESIRLELARSGNLGIDPRHVEAFIRVAHSTLDGLSRVQMKQEISIAVSCIQVEGISFAEGIAKSFGL